MAIELTQMCQALNALPGPGGVLDQDSYLMYLMQTVMSAQAEKQELDRQREARASAQTRR